MTTDLATMQAERAQLDQQIQAAQAAEALKPAEPATAFDLLRELGAAVFTGDQEKAFYAKVALLESPPAAEAAQGEHPVE